MSENLISTILRAPLKCPKSIRLALLCIFIQFVSYSQTQSISTSVGFTRFDIFHSIEYSVDTNRCDFSTSFGYGMNRSLFQQKLFPRFSIGFRYSALQKNRLELGPLISYSLSFIKFTPHSKATIWNELNTGFFWSYGNRWKIGQSIMVGYVSQSHFSTIQQKRTTGRTLGYYADLKLSYAL